MLYLSGTAEMPLMDRDEPKFAHATVEMMDRGSWAVPYFNGEYRFDKPPLTYWWMWLHYKVFGIGELAARLHSVLAVWLIALVIRNIGRRLADETAGLVAAGAWLVTLQVLVHGRLCVADMPMVLFVTLAMRALLELLLAPSAGFGRWYWTLYLSLGFGFLAKGPIAIIVPGLAMVLFRLAFWRKPMSWRRLGLGRGSLLALLIVAAWGIPALLMTDGLFWKVGMGEHVVERGGRAFNGRFPLPGYYLVTALASLFPWIAALPMVWRGVRRDWSMEQALLVSWFVAPYLIFSFYATQLSHYVMPGFPAAVLLLALHRQEWMKGQVLCSVWGKFCVGLMVLLAAVAFYAAPRLPVEIRPVVTHGALFLLLLSVASGCLFAPRVRWLGLALLPLVSCMIASVAGDLRRVHPAVQLAAKLKAGPDEKLTAWEFNEPSLVFYFDHSWKFTSKVETVIKALDKKEPHVVLLLSREWTLSEALKSGGLAKDHTAVIADLLKRFPDHEFTRFAGMNAARSSWVELVALRKSTTNPSAPPPQ